MIANRPACDAIYNRDRFLSANQDAIRFSGFDFRNADFPGQIPSAGFRGKESSSALRLLFLVELLERGITAQRIPARIEAQIARGD